MEGEEEEVQEGNGDEVRKGEGGGGGGGRRRRATTRASLSLSAVKRARLHTLSDDTVTVQ